MDKTANRERGGRAITDRKRAALAKNREKGGRPGAAMVSPCGRVRIQMKGNLVDVEGGSVYVSGSVLVLQWQGKKWRGAAGAWPEAGEYTLEYWPRSKWGENKYFGEDAAVVEREHDGRVKAPVAVDGWLNPPPGYVSKPIDMEAWRKRTDEIIRESERRYAEFEAVNEWTNTRPWTWMDEKRCGRDLVPHDLVAPPELQHVPELVEWWKRNRGLPLPSREAWMELENYRLGI